MSWLEPFAWALAVVVSVPLLVLAVECLAASARRVKVTPTPDPFGRPRAAVLIPAHDEELVIARTLTALIPQLSPGDRVVVVADNCSDATAEIARNCGAEVVERFDATRRGKGYALAFGLDQLRPNPPEVVVIVDADCVVGDRSFGKLVEAATETGRPVQGAYRMDPPPAAGPERRVAAFAFLVKNVVRPLGLRRLGSPCLLTGTGMAFPWAVIADANLGHGHIVEDMQLAVDLAVAGKPAAFVADADVRGEFPSANAAAGSQRKRWEHGHLQVLFGGAPRLLATAVRRGRPDLLALGLELTVPPLSALMMIWLATAGVLALFVVAGGSASPLVMLVVAWAMAVVGVFFAWSRFGRNTLPVKEFVRVPMYAAKKIPLYLGYFAKPQTAWIRTDRERAFPSS